MRNASTTRNSWPPGKSEMARRIREHDWAATPLGQISTWPQSLCTVVDLVLASGVPMILLWGPDLHQLYNDGYCDLMGQKHLEGLGQPTQACWPEVWSLNGPIYDRVWAGETVTLEDAHYPITRSGPLQDAWFTLSYSPLRDEAGAIAGILVTVVETTRRVKEDASRQARDAQFHAVVSASPEVTSLFEAMNQGFCTIEVIFDERGSPADYLYLGITPSFARATGLDNPIGQRMRDLVPAHEGYWYEAFGRVAQTGTPEHFEAEAAALGRWFTVHAYRIGDPAQHHVGLLFEDITQRHQVEVALRESEERNRLIVEEATDYAIFSADDARRIESWSPGATAAFGWTPDEAIGQLMDITYTPEDRAQGIPGGEVAQARQEGQAPNVRWHQRKDGSRVFIEGMAYARRGADGVFHGVFKVGQDVTERVLAEQTRRKHEARLREELEAEVAATTMELRALSRRLLRVQEEERRRLALELHDEIGQVLTALAFQLAAVPGPDGDAALAEARTTVQLLTDQVRQLALDLRPGVLDRYGLLVAVQWYIDRFQATTGITVHLRAQDVEQQRFAAEVEIAAFRVVQEALTNIARYAGVREAWVTLLHDGSLLLVIHDLGQGFAPERYRESSGLSGMRERVELLGGSFMLEAAPGDGVHITAEFPLEEPDPEAGQLRSAETQLETPA